MISNFENIDNNNIICIGKNHIFFIGQKKSNEFFLKKIKIITFNNQHPQETNAFIDK